MARLLSDAVIGRPWRERFGLPLRFWMFTRVTVTLKVCSTAARTVCFVAAIFVTPIWLRVLFVAGALLLPYVAVVMANAGSSKSDGFALLDGPSGARELGQGHGSGETPGRDHL